MCYAHSGVNCTYAGVGTGERHCVNLSFTREESDDGNGGMWGDRNGTRVKCEQTSCLSADILNDVKTLLTD